MNVYILLYARFSVYPVFCIQMVICTIIVHVYGMLPVVYTPAEADADLVLFLFNVFHP